MKIDLEFAEFHIPVFLNGVNWGQKLFKKQAKGTLTLTYDQAEKELIIVSGDFTGIIPTASNVAMMQPTKDAKKWETPTPVIKPEEPVKRGPGRPAISSQVTTPTDHVFAKGPGKTNDR